MRWCGEDGDREQRFVFPFNSPELVREWSAGVARSVASLAGWIPLPGQFFDGAWCGGFEVDQPDPFRCDGDSNHLLVYGTDLRVEGFPCLRRYGAVGSRTEA